MPHAFAGFSGGAKMVLPGLANIESIEWTHKAVLRGLRGKVLPERPLRQWVLSLTHALRFLLPTNPAALTPVLGVVYRTISRHLIGKAGLTRACGATGAVTLIQRFSSALNLNVHLHMIPRGTKALVLIVDWT